MQVMGGKPQGLIFRVNSTFCSYLLRSFAIEKRDCRDRSREIGAVKRVGGREIIWSGGNIVNQIRF